MIKCDARASNVEGSSRREFIGEVGMAFAVSLLPLGRAPAAPDAANAFPLSDVRHYGIVPNRPDAASANTAALATLVSPTTGTFSGNLTFPNTTGRDVYYFNDMIAFREGVHINLMNSTLNFSKIGVARDSSTGFVHALRDFSIENGSIVVDYTHKAGANTGNALAFGSRGNDTVLFPNIYDSLLPASMGKIVVRNIHISSNSGGGEGRAILMLGGLDGVLLDTVTIEGQKQLFQGIYYEFGWATNEEKEYLRQTSHAHNFQVKNLTVSNVMREGFGANGLYNVVIDGIKVVNSGAVCGFGPGEAEYFRVWSGVGPGRSKPNVVIRNAVGESISGVGISVTGAGKISASFLDNPPAHNNPNGLAVEHQTDLIDFTLDTFSITGTVNNYGVLTSARRAVIRNGTITGFQRGVVTTQECTKFHIEGVTVLDSTGLGMQLGQPQSLHNPPRLASGVVRRCVVAGSGTAASSAAIAVGTTQSCVIEDCRFGYDQSHDHKAERTQAQAVIVAADAFEVVCRNNFVGGIAGNVAAYVLIAAPSGSRGCRLDDNKGIITATGAWQTGRQGFSVQTVRSAGQIDISGMHSIWVSAPSAVTGVRIQSGEQDRQAVLLIHDGLEANSIAFGPPGTSNVEDGTPPLVGRSSRILIWSAEKKLWQPVN